VDQTCTIFIFSCSIKCLCISPCPCLICSAPKQLPLFPPPLCSFLSCMYTCARVDPNTKASGVKTKSQALAYTDTTMVTDTKVNFSMTLCMVKAHTTKLMAPSWSVAGKFFRGSFALFLCLFLARCINDELKLTQHTVMVAYF
jgi:hypothetical protein